ncbi:hypothetical protein VWM68_11320, partial [Campylobacter coli]
ARSVGKIDILALISKANFILSNYGGHKGAAGLSLDLDSFEKFENFIFCVNYKKQIIEDYFKKGKNFGVKIFYIKERKKLGTAG